MNDPALADPLVIAAELAQLRAQHRKWRHANAITIGLAALACLLYLVYTAIPGYAVLLVGCVTLIFLNYAGTRIARAISFAAGFVLSGCVFAGGMAWMAIVFFDRAYQSAGLLVRLPAILCALVGFTMVAMIFSANDADEQITQRLKKTPPPPPPPDDFDHLDINKWDEADGQSSARPPPPAPKDA